jgi:glyoxylase-like metal-dependent hydrolase (beta-lactamase superfamily II)
MIRCELGDFTLFWLNGGEFELDGGTMFGVVPKELWSKKFPVAADDPAAPDDNHIKLLNAPLLVRTPEARVIIDTGLGNKLTEKQKEIFRVTRDWDVIEELKRLALTRQDITHVILTHYDFDHGGGIVMHNEAGEEELTFPNAAHIVQQREWEDVLAPNIRSEKTYWPENFAKLLDSANLQLVEGNHTVCPGIAVEHTGGHTRGHQVVRIASGSEVAYHLADLLPTHAHFNPLWIMAYDNFPLEAIALKQQYEKRGIRENAWFTFYHDPFMFACRFDADGRVVENIGQAPPAPKKIPVQDINVIKDKSIVLTCPDCLLVREVPVAKYMGAKHFMTVKCSCGATYGVNLNYRKHYRKDVSLGGYYAAADADVVWAGMSGRESMPINCRIQNISMGGIGFTALDMVRVKLDDTLKVKFTLDKDPPEVVEKKIFVRTIRDNYIGCEFTKESMEYDTTLGFYLMK